MRACACVCVPRECVRLSLSECVYVCARERVMRVCAPVQCARACVMSVSTRARVREYSFFFLYFVSLVFVPRQLHQSQYQSSRPSLSLSPLSELWPYFLVFLSVTESPLSLTGFWL